MLRTIRDLVVRRHPVVVLAAMLAVGVAIPGEPFTLLATLPVYGIAAWRSWRAAALAVVGVGAATLVHELLHGASGSGSLVAVTLSSLATAAAAGALGVAVGERRRAREREATLLAEQTLTEERLRIARELHDAVGHDVSLMIVQAQALGATAGDEAVREATDAIAALGRHTMGEMSRTLRLLRHDGVEHRPQPGLGALDEVLDGARGAGVAVTLAIEGSPRALPAALDACAFRIVQEAVTNVVRHAGGAPASVTLRYGPAELELAIADEGGAAGDGAPAGGGHGLVGMRERATLFGGTLHAGPRDGGGYEVRALLPYGPEANGR